MSVIICLAAPLVSARAGSSNSIDATYQQLRTRVLQLSPDIRAAQAASDQRNAGVYTAWTKWIPRADLQFSQTRAIDYSILTSGALGSQLTSGSGSTPFINITPVMLSLSRWSLSLNAPIYRRDVHLGIEQANADKDVANRQLGMRISEVDWRLRSLLGDYLHKQYKIATLNTSIELAKASLREAKLRFELGERTRVDVLRAEANLISLESKILTYDQERVASQSALVEYSGLTQAEFRAFFSEANLGSEASIAEAIDRFTDVTAISKRLEPLLMNAAGTAPTENLAEVRERLAKQIGTSSPVYQSYLAEQSASDTRARSIMAHEWPELHFEANVNKQAQDWTTAFASDNRSHSLAIILNIPLFTGGSLFSTASEKSNAQEANGVKRERDILRLKDEVEEQFVQIGALRKTIESQKLNLDRTTELVRLSQKSYQLGKTTLLELLTSQNDLVDSKLALAQTKLNASVLLRRFAWNLGVSLE